MINFVFAKERFKRQASVPPLTGATTGGLTLQKMGDLMVKPIIFITGLKNKNPGNPGVVGMLSFKVAPQHGLEPRT